MFANLRFIVSFPTFLKLMEFKNKLNEEPQFDKWTRIKLKIQQIEQILSQRDIEGIGLLNNYEDEEDNVVGQTLNKAIKKSTAKIIAKDWSEK